MGRTIKRLALALLLLILVAAAAIGISIYRGRGQETYAELAKASLPVLHLLYEEENGWENELHGYTREMDLASMRGQITPLAADRSVKIYLSEAGADAISYQLRSLDGSRLVENGPVERYEESEKGRLYRLQLSTLVEPEQEYALILTCTQGERKVTYYSRVIYLKEGNTADLIGFARRFMEAQIGKDTDFIVNYISPDGSMGTDDYAYANQHSRSGMLTYGNLKAARTGEVRMQVTELTASQATISLTYPLQLYFEPDTYDCTVTERFVVRSRNKVLYLLDYSRSVNENFSSTHIRFDGGDIWLGVCDEQPLRMVSASGKVAAFVYQGQLISYDEARKLLTPVFTFRDGGDIRGSLPGHAIRMVRAEDNGDLLFIVYGYQNRGRHEGEVGICFYRYRAESAVMEELFFLPVEQSEDVLLARMGALSFVGEDADLLYLLYGSTVYSIDLASGEKAQLANVHNFCRSEDGSLIGWEEGDTGFPGSLCVADLTDGRIDTVTADPGDYLSLQGFIGSDVVYGIGRRADVEEKAGEVITKPLYALRIALAREGLTEEGSYEDGSSFILGTDIADSRICLHRVVRRGAGYAQAEDDYLFLNDKAENALPSVLKVSSRDGILRVASARLGADAEVSLLSKRIGYRDSENAFRISLDESKEGDAYYAYGGGGLAAVSDTPGEAIGRIFDLFGCVTDGGGNYIWQRDARDLRKHLALNSQAAGSGSTLEQAIRLLCAAEGGRASVLANAGGKESVTELLADALPGKRVLNLHGCSLTQVLYYVHLSHPVLAITGDDEAMLIIGYDSQSVILCDPAQIGSGEEGADPELTLTMAEAQEYFAQADNQFVSCLDR